MANDVKVIFVSGVHGIGKTTMIENLREYLFSQGHDVRVLPEFDTSKTSSGYNPGDPRFQVWYKYNILERERKVLSKLKYYNGDQSIYLLFDRSAIDVELYNMYYKDVKEEIDIIIDHATPSDFYTLSFMQHGFPLMFNFYQVAFIHLGATINDLNVIQDRVDKRLEKETHRKDWNESDFTYLKGVSDKFNEFYEKMADNNAPIVAGLTSYDEPEKILNAVDHAYDLSDILLGKKSPET